MLITIFTLISIIKGVVNLKNLLVIKLTNVGETEKSIIERIRGDWKVSPKRLDDVEHVIVLEDQEIVGTFSMGNVFTYNRMTGRVSDLDLVQDNTLDIIGKKVDYATSNPATLASIEGLRIKE